jgi:hypothetical protein
MTMKNVQIFLHRTGYRPTIIAILPASWVNLSTNSCQKTVLKMEKSLETITKWVRDSGLKVNQDWNLTLLQTWLDHYQDRKQQKHWGIKNNKYFGYHFWLYTQMIRTTNAINRLIQNLNAIKLIRKEFNTTELISMVTSIFYLIF